MRGRCCPVPVTPARLHGGEGPGHRPSLHGAARTGRDTAWRGPQAAQPDGVPCRAPDLGAACDAERPRPRARPPRLGPQNPLRSLRSEAVTKAVGSHTSEPEPQEARPQPPAATGDPGAPESAARPLQEGPRGRGRVWEAPPRPLAHAGRASSRSVRGLRAPSQSGVLAGAAAERSSDPTRTWDQLRRTTETLPTGARPRGLPGPPGRSVSGRRRGGGGGGPPHSRPGPGGLRRGSWT